MVQKGVGADFHNHQPAAALDTASVYAAIRGFSLATCPAECAEILLTQQNVAGLVHQIEIQGMPVPRYQAIERRRLGRRIAYDVAVTTLCRTKTGVEIVTHRCRPVHSYIIRQVSIRAQNPSLDATPREVIKVNNLRVPVNAGIGPAGTGSGDTHTCNR